MNDVNPELAVDLAELATEPELVAIDTVEVTFSVPTGHGGTSPLTKARSLGMMLTQQLGLADLTVTVKSGIDGESATQTLPLSDHELVELQLAIADSVRENDPEFAAILEEAAAAASQH